MKTSQKTEAEHHTPKRYDNVKFSFLSYVNKENATLLGIVLFRDNEMVIDIQDRQAPVPYLIVGKLNENYFQGINSFQKPSRSIEAKWAKVGNSYVGTWLEEGVEFLFSFNLPKT